MKNKDYEKYMLMALELATKGWGKVSPNPMVGAVTVSGREIVGKGFHAGAGLPHAEVGALKSAGKKAKGALLVVNLEPCCHQGKTPACTELIIKSGIKKVVYGMKDPNSLVNGKGLTALRKAGVEVIGPVLKKECENLNRIFVHWIKTGRPYVISKVAVSLDGKIATKSGDSKWITGEKCRRRMHYWRSGVDAVLVGAGTVRKDDPQLSARGLGGVRQPRPVIITTDGNLLADKKILKRMPIVFCTSKKTTLKGAQIVPVGTKDKKICWDEILGRLGTMGVTSVMVEGGADIHAQVMEKSLANYMVASVAPKLLGGNSKSWLPSWGVTKVKNSPQITPDQILVCDNDIVIEGEVTY